MKGFNRDGSGEASITAIIVVMLIVMLLTIGILGFYLGSKTALGSPTKDHKFIVNEITMVDTTFAVQATIEFLHAGGSPILEVSPTTESEQFTVGTELYELSEWRWHIHGDPNAYMNIWGAGDDGQTFYIEIVSLSDNKLELSTPTGKYTLTPQKPNVEFLIILIPK